MVDTSSATSDALPILHILEVAGDWSDLVNQKLGAVLPLPEPASSLCSLLKDYQTNLQLLQTEAQSRNSSGDTSYDLLNVNIPYSVVQDLFGEGHRPGFKANVQYIETKLAPPAGAVKLQEDAGLSGVESVEKHSGNVEPKRRRTSGRAEEPDGILFLVAAAINSLRAILTNIHRINECNIDVNDYYLKSLLDTYSGNSGRPVSKFARIFQKIITYNHSTNKHTFKFLETKAECYQIGRHIDSGGSSNVYECFTVEDFDEEFRVRVTDRNFVPAKEKQHKVLAVKVLDGDLDRANLEQEVKNIQRLNHMHVIRARAIGSFEGNVGIVLEPRAYGDGGNNNLREYLTTHLRTDPQDAGGILSKNRSQIIRHLIGWMRCLLGTICYLHSEGIRHRDIKPENILIHDTRIILTDFGISFPTGTTKHSNKWNTTQPGTTTNVGTMKYLPPDAIIDSNKAGDQSGIINRVGKGGDIFSLGCVFWEMLELLWKPSRVVFSQPKSSKSYADFWQTMRLGGGGKTGIYEKIGKMVDQLDDFLDKESKKGENAKDIEALRTVMVETLFLIPNMVMVRFNRQLDALRLRSRLETAIRDSWSVIRAHESVRGEREFCPCTVE